MIQRKSELVKLVVEVVDGKVNATGTYASGAWDGDKQEWVGQPREVTEVFGVGQHDLSKVKGAVGQMLLHVSAAHEGLKKDHATELVEHGQTKHSLQKEKSDAEMLERLTKSYARDLAEVTKQRDAAISHRNQLLAEADARASRLRNPVLHTLTLGRAGR